MATFNASSAYGFFVLDVDAVVNALFDNAVDASIEPLPTFFSFGYFDAVLRELEFYGTGFTYFAASTPTGGTATSIVCRAGSGTFFEIVGFSVPLKDLFLAGIDSYAKMLALLGNLTVNGAADNEILKAGPHNDSMFGFAGADTLKGEAGDDRLDGGPGADALRGGPGNDLYIIDASDTIDESVGGSSGSDTIQAAFTFSLTGNPKIKGLVENLTLTGNALIDGTGNELANTIRGNAAANMLNGLLGNDTLFGGLGLDGFRFTTALDKKTNVDHIGDFSTTDDTIFLDNAIFTKLKEGVLKAKNFERGKKPGDKNDFIAYNKKNGVAIYDENGSKKGGAVKFAVLDNSPDDLSNAHFFVV
jgi:Ca2+-binding RTX toxin-like protein